MALNRRKLLLIGMGSSLTLITGGLWAAPQLLSGSINSNTGTAAARRTRVTVETDAPVKFRYFTLPKPDRLVIDIEGIVQNRALSTLAQQIPPADSFIANIRLGQKDAQTVRLVFDLKQPVNAKIIALKPSGSLKHRLQIDMQTKSGSQTQAPAAAAPVKGNQDDPLMAMLEQRQREREAAARKVEQTKPAAKRRPVVVIDAGHGGKDPGAIGPSGVKEKDVTLAVARDIQKRLSAKGIDVRMTRNDDTFVSLKNRRNLAHDVKADLFVSIHANASENPEPRGTDIFIWAAQPNSERARKLQKAENEADDVAGLPSVGNKNVDMILTDMMRTQTGHDSARLGSLMLRNVARHNRLRSVNVDKADFAVLRSVDIPSVLVELAFLSNPADEKLLASNNFRSQMGAAISDGIVQYLKNAVLQQ